MEEGNNASYLEYVLGEESYLQSGKCVEDRTFWLDMYDSIPENSSISSDILKGKRTTYIMDDSLMSEIDTYTRQNRITINGFFVGAYLLYAYKKTGNTDQIIGIPLLGRVAKNEREMFGNFTNTMPYRYQINNNLAVNDVMKEVMKDLKKVYLHQRYPYNKLCEDIKLSENKKERLYDVCINYYNTSLPTNMEQISVQNTEFYNGQQEYAMQIILRHWNHVKMQLDFDYQLAVYTEEMISDIYQELMLLIRKIVRYGTRPVKDLNLLEEQEYDSLIYGFNCTDVSYVPEKTWLDLFQECVSKYVDRIALSKGKECISYEELDRRSDIMAHILCGHGIKKGDIVAIIPKYDMASIASIVGIIKIGAVYLPIDEKLPHGRRSNILSESGTEYLVAYENETDFQGNFIKLTEDVWNEAYEEMDKGMPPCEEDMAYIIYTSGSTGTPKGVIITHKNLMNYLQWAKDTYIKRDKEVFPLYSSFSFDFTITSLFLPLICGGEIRLYDNLDGRNVFKYILEDNQSTIVKITPSHIALITDIPVKSSSIHTFILGGENLKTEVCRKLFNHFNRTAEIYNEYGPTEATVGCMIYRFQDVDNEEAVSIGKPISNTQIYMLDKDLQPVPKYALGEIYIGGASVAQGYYKGKKENNARFIKNPFIPDGKMYRTGDLAAFKEDGKLYYYGRNDNELKIRGNRVNLSEIESKIMESKMASDVVVKTVKLGNTEALCAYLLSEQIVPIDKLKTYLREELTDYMVPEFYETLQEFPLTINGKVDADKLPIPSKDTISDKDLTDNEALAQLLKIAEHVLHDSESILPDSNFFLLGGDSIKAIQISSHMFDNGYELSVKNILQNPIFYEMAREVKQKVHITYEQGICKGEVGNLPITEWFFNQKFQQEGQYNQSVLLELKKDVSIETINSCFCYLIKHHDTLRLNYDQEKKGLYYNNQHLKEGQVVKSISLSEDDNEVDMSEITEQLADPLFDLSHDLLIRPYLIRKGKKEYLLIIAHHLIMDAVSIRILLEDLGTLLALPKEKYSLPEKTASYAEFSKSLLQRSQSEKLNKNMWNFEKDELFPYKNKKEEESKTAVLELEMSEKISQYVKKEANDTYNTKPEELQLIALAQAIQDITQEEDIRIQVEGHGRNLIEDINVNRTIGWFTVLYPLSLKVKPESLSKQINDLKTQIRSRKRIGYEFGLLKYYRKEPLKEASTICMNYLGEYTEESSNYFEVKQIFNSSDSSQLNSLPYSIMVNTLIYQRKLKIYITYRCNWIEEDVMKKLAEGFQFHLKRIVEHCINKNGEEITPQQFHMVDLTSEELGNLLL